MNPDYIAESLLEDNEDDTTALLGEIQSPIAHDYVCVDCALRCRLLTLLPRRSCSLDCRHYRAWRKKQLVLQSLRGSTP